MRIAFLALLALVLAACGKSDDITPPTIMQLPTLSPSVTPLPATATPTTTATATPSATPSPTATDSPSPSPTATATDSPSPSPTATPVKIVIQSAVGAFARSGPNTNYPAVGEVGANDGYYVVAFTVNTEGDVWYLIDLPDGTPAWVSQVVAARVDDAPLGQVVMAVTVPASPTLSPTPTLTATPTLTPTPTLPPGANARIYDDSRVNLRVGPSLSYTSLGLLRPYAPLVLVGRNEAGTWLQAYTFDGRSGWILGELVVMVQVAVAALPVTWTGPPVPDGLVFTDDVMARSREIFARGQQRGSRPNAFIVIGDSTIANTRVWNGIFHSIQHNAYNLGSYPDLQRTIDFYRPGNSFGENYQTARAGYATRDILDPSWADPAVCRPGENLLTCEIRRSQPGFAIIYIGHIDLQNRAASSYAGNLDTIVRVLIQSGVIPVLNTVTYSDAFANVNPHPEWLEYMNTTIRDTAARYQLPLVEFRRAARRLPNQGCIEDGRHLSFRFDGVVNFGGDEQRFGKDLRELMNLQMMELLRAYVFQG